MARHFRDRLALTYALWSVMLVATSGALAWKFGWIPIEITTDDPVSEKAAAKAPEELINETASLDSVETLPVESDAAPLQRGMPEWAADEQAEPASEMRPSAARASGRPRRADDEGNPFETADNEDATTRPMAAARVPVRDEEPAEPYSSDLEPDVVRRKPGGIDYSTIPVESPPGSLDGMTVIRPQRSNPAGSKTTSRTGAATRTAKAGATMLDEPDEPGLPLKRPGRITQLVHEETLSAPSPRRVVRAGGEKTATKTKADASDPRLQEIDKLLSSGERLEAHKEMSRLYWKEPELIPELQTRIDDNAALIYFEPQPHFMEPCVVAPGDKLSTIAKKYSISWEYLAKLNKVDPRKIRADQRLKVIKGPFAATVDLSDFELIVHCHGYYVRRYPIGIGKNGSTPTGKFTVKLKERNPKYWGPNGNVIEADDPSNPLGERWIDLGDSYGIHGTIDPSSIGKAESKGCIRLKNADVEEVYDLLTEGSEVVIRP